MTLPFGTRVSLNTDPTVLGVVVGVSSSTREGYAVAWPNGTRETRWREELTVVPPVAWPLWAVTSDCELDYIRAPTAEHARSWYAAENGVAEEDLSVHPAKTAEEHLSLTMHAYETATARAADLSRALRAIAALLGLPPDAEPKAVVDAFKRGALREAMRPPLEIKITGEGEARMVMESACARTLRVVSAKDVAPTDWVWGYIEDTGAGWDHPEVVLSEEETPWLRSRNLHSYTVPHIVGPDPALLLGEK